MRTGYRNTFFGLLESRDFFIRLLSKIFHFSPQVARAMLNQTLADHLRQKIWDNMTHDNVSYYAQSLSDTDYGTTHVAVLAENGDAVSVTTTINRK